MDAVLYLEMVTDGDDPNFNESEARRLAASLAAIPRQIRDPKLAQSLANFARWGDETVERIGGYLEGKITRAAFETFLSRRPWPDTSKAAVQSLKNDKLESFAKGLAEDNYALVARSLYNLDGDDRSY
jgi:hypothetical protein